jgi:5-hydroxyisourate hydrolase
MSPITTHVLDTSRGRPAAGVAVVLETRTDSGQWKQLGKGATDADGRVRDLLPAKYVITAGVYRLTFDTGGYYRGLKIDCFYPSVSIVFEVRAPSEHFHVPLLLSPFGYSTYRGS